MEKTKENCFSTGAYYCRRNRNTQRRVVGSLIFNFTFFNLNKALKGKILEEIYHYLRSL